MEKAAARDIAVAVAAKLVGDRVNDGSADFYAFTPAPAGGPVGRYQVQPIFLALGSHTVYLRDFPTYGTSKRRA